MNLLTPTTDGAGPLLAVAYLRDQGPEGIDPQRDHCRQTADQLGAQLVAEYVDIGSATTARHPGLDALLARLKEEPAVRYVLVAGLDRLVRSMRTFLDVSDALIESKVSLVDSRHGTVIADVLVSYLPVGPFNLRPHAAVAEHFTDLTGRACQDRARAVGGG